MTNNEFDNLFDDIDLFIKNSCNVGKKNIDDDEYTRLISPKLFPECYQEEHKCLDSVDLELITKRYIAYMFSKFLSDYIVSKDSCCSFGPDNGQLIYDRLVELLGQISRTFSIKSKHHDITLYLANFTKEIK